MKGLKIAACLACIAFTCSIFLFQGSQISRGQRLSTGNAEQTSNPSMPDQPDIDRFNDAMQKRFLTEPFFGIARMAPTTPQPLRSGHVGGFHPQGEEETSILSEFQKDGWKVGLYLFGRRAVPDEKRKNPLEKFKIRYRLNQPLPITGVEEKELPGSKKLIDEVKSAFLAFQAAENPARVRYQFSRGEWTYIAKPVLAMNQNCLKCHTDYVITEKLDDGKFKFRKRAVGDVNGIIVYGFTKSAEMDEAQQ